MSKFEVGDKVVCVDPDPCNDLVGNAPYQIRHVRSGFVKVHGNIQEFFESRFVHAPVTPPPAEDKALAYLKAKLDDEDVQDGIDAEDFIYAMLREVYGLTASTRTVREFVTV